MGAFAQSLKHRFSFFALLGLAGLVLTLSACQPGLAVPEIDKSPSEPAPAVTPTGVLAWRLAEGVPPALRARLTLPAGLPEAASPEQAALIFDLSQDQQPAVAWVYALTAAFPTVEDGYSLDQIRALWAGNQAAETGKNCLLLSPQTAAALTRWWGAPPSPAVEQRPAEQLLETAWQRRGCLAILPFEEISPRWKVLEVDNQSPLHGDFNPETYPLTLRFSWRGNDQLAPPLPEGNWRRDRMSIVLITGTTALTRGTAARMAEMGAAYPGEKIRSWFTQADLAHISNEVSFTSKCPAPDPFSPSLMFCSAPENMQLFEYLGVDVIEVTGNHVADYGMQPFLDTLKAYRERGWKYYAAGSNLEEARQPLRIEHNGNRIAFLGCNQAGPQEVWAGADRPGVAECNLDDLKNMLADLKARGYTTIVTIQYDESYRSKPTELQERFFQAVSAAGADIVSGSQAHYPQAFAFSEQGFIHYGPGNLFFDQMDYPVVGTRREFLVRYVVYDNRLAGIELLTAMLEDYAQPRPMTADERRSFLQEYFTASGW